MKRLCEKILVFSFAFLVFLVVDAGEKKASSLLAYCDGSTASVLRIEVDDQAGQDQLETDLEAENRKLRERVDSLRQQNQFLSQAQASEPRLPLHRERELLEEENRLLVQQNRILAEFCPLLKEAARNEFSGGCDPDVALAWDIN